MIQQILDTIEQNNMFENGDKVLVAVSGGPDSICLLHAINTLKKQLGINIIVAHVNHCLRGLEADKDEEYVHNFCEALKIECYSKRIDINKIATEKNISTETAGREARYEYFFQLKEKYGLDKIALAHNANDQAETVLMRIMRGTGMEGLAGIKYVRDSLIVRPLLSVERKEIEKYCNEKNLNPRIDKSNLESIYTRNKIRLELIPYIENNFNKDIVDSLIRLSDSAEKDNNFIEKHVQLNYKKYCNRKDGKVIISNKAFEEDEALLTRLIRRALLEVKGDLYNFEKIHIYDIINIQKQGTGRKLILPGKLQVYNNYGDIYISFKKNEEASSNYEKPLEIGIVNEVSSTGINITMKLFQNDLKYNIEDNSYIKYFDYDKVKKGIVIRNRREGDRFSPLGMKGSKKLKDLFIDLKINKQERDEIPLICFGDDIAWIVGYKISDKFKITSATNEILQIEVERT